MTYNDYMHTIIETPVFQKLWSNYWTEDERGTFAAWLSLNPESGDVVPGSGGIRKVRWKRAGSGKSGGVRIIYYNRLANGQIWLLLIYAKNEFDTIVGSKLKEFKDAIEESVKR